MRRPGRSTSARTPPVERQASPNSFRDRLALALALATIICLGAVFLYAKGMQFLSPGPLASVHGSIEACSACHTTSGKSKSSWIHGLVAGDPEADSNACLSCHKMPDTAFKAHGAPAEVLKLSTTRLAKLAAETPVPRWAGAQSAAFPTNDMVAHGLYCSTCHREHRGANANLAKISNEQCQACHVVKFDSFDGHHPDFASYPFKRRTPIIYDHAAHGKRFSEAAKKEPSKRVPATCSSCHNDRSDRRIMSVAGFDQTCSSCHLGQITGKERVSGPKGIAFLALPGIDVQTLRKRNAPIGEWPADSEAELTPFMKVMISRNERGRVLIRNLADVSLQDLSGASDDQIKAVTDLVWEIKRLFYALISGKASDVLGNLNFGCGAKLSPGLVADLTASIPRDVLIGAQRQWLPNLGTEMASRKDTSDPDQGCLIATTDGWVTTIAESGLAVQQAKAEGTADAAPKDLRIDALGGLAKERADEAEAPAPKAEPRKADTTSLAPVKEVPPAAGPPKVKASDHTDDLLHPTDEELGELKRHGFVKGYVAYAGSGDGKDTRPDHLRAIDDGAKDKIRIAQADGPAPKPAADAATRGADQTDDLLNLTEEELRGLPAALKGDTKAVQPEGRIGKADIAKPKGDGGSTDATRRAEKAAPPKEVTGKVDAPNATVESAPSADAAPKSEAKAPSSPPPGSGTAPAAPQAKVTPVISIQSGIDAESWAEYGGWYRQDYTIYYRPTGHKDKLIYSWLFLTGPQAPKGDAGPAAAVFDFLTTKDAQGACTKCHSVDDIQGKGRMVNFSPPSIAVKQGRFTRFIHEPHFSVLEHRGCLTCHNLGKDRSYLQSYAQGDPEIFVPNFAPVKKELCQTCHTSGMARQDCLLCHKYHVNGATMPTMSTRIPSD